MAQCTNIIRNSVKRSETKDEVSYTLDYTAIFDGPADPALASIANVNGKFIPQIGYKIPAKITERPSFVESVDAAAINDDHTKFKVTCKASSKAGDGALDGGGGGGGGDPSTQAELPKTRIEWGVKAYTITRDHDANDKPITNSAGSYFNPPGIDQEDGDEVATITNYVKTFDPVKFRQKAKRLNKDAFLNYAPGEALLDDWSARQQSIENDDGTTLSYWELTFTVAFRIGGWDRQLLDHGTVQLVDATNEVFDPSEPGEFDDGRVAAPKVKITDKNGHPIECGLDGHGKALKPGQPPHPLFFPVYKSITFADLGIDTKI